MGKPGKINWSGIIVGILFTAVCFGCTFYFLDVVDQIASGVIKF